MLDWNLFINVDGIWNEMKNINFRDFETCLAGYLKKANYFTLSAAILMQNISLSGCAIGGNAPNVE